MTDIDSAINGMLTLLRVAYDDRQRAGHHERDWRDGYFFGLQQGLRVLEALGKKSAKRKRKAVAA